jgi:hypothetical protein
MSASRCSLIPFKNSYRTSPMNTDQLINSMTFSLTHSLSAVCAARERDGGKKEIKVFSLSRFSYVHNREMWNERKKPILSCNIMCTTQYYVHNKLVSLHCRDFSSFAPSQKPLGAIVMVLCYVLFSLDHNGPRQYFKFNVTENKFKASGTRE